MASASSFQWVKDPTPLSQLSPAFILPEELRPQLSDVSTLSFIPIIDLSEGDEAGDAFAPSLLEKLSKACEEYGFFHVINHGVPEELCARMLEAMAQMFAMPPSVKAELAHDDPSLDTRLFSRHLKVPGHEQGRVSMWSECLYHPWHPFQDFTSNLSKGTPQQYREVIPEYVKELSKLFTRLLRLISVSLGLDKDRLETRHGESPMRRVQANYYPPCPDPDLALGLATHTDLHTLTILQQSGQVSGLQVIKDGEWVCVDPIPNSFVVNVGDQLQVLSNGRYKSVHHRAVTNKDELRVSIAIFFGPDNDTMVSPIDELLDQDHPPLYTSYKYEEFVKEFVRQDGTRRRVKEVFELPPSILKT